MNNQYNDEIQNDLNYIYRNFDLVNNTYYYLYQNYNDEKYFSLKSPNEWIYYYTFLGTYYYNLKGKFIKVIKKK